MRETYYASRITHHVSCLMSHASRFIPIVALLRLLVARARVRRLLGGQADVQPAWPVWLALALLAALALLDIWSLTL